MALPASRVRRGPFGRETAVELTRQLLALRRPPTAIFAASDVQAFGVLDAAARAGLSVPGDLSVIGFDDIELAAAIGLTTVRQPLRESGRVGAQLLLRALNGEPAAAPLATAAPRSGRAPHRFATTGVIRHTPPLTRAVGPIAWNRFQ